MEIVVCISYPGWDSIIQAGIRIPAWIGAMDRENMVVFISNPQCRSHASTWFEYLVLCVGADPSSLHFAARTKVGLMFGIASIFLRYASNGCTPVGRTPYFAALRFEPTVPCSCTCTVRIFGSVRWSGEGGIRTHGTLPYTRFPSVRLKPLGHLSMSSLPLNRTQRAPIYLPDPEIAKV